MLQWCISKINEVATDLREPQQGANLDHQAAKLEKVRDELQALSDLMLSSTKVHGGGTGRD